VSHVHYLTWQVVCAVFTLIFSVLIIIIIIIIDLYSAVRL